MIKNFTFKGIKEVKQIFEQTQDCIGLPIRKLAEKINNYWGYEVISKSQLQVVISTSNRTLKHHHIMYLAPFTPYDVDTLLNVATGNINIEDLENQVDLKMDSIFSQNCSEYTPDQNIQ